MKIEDNTNWKQNKCIWVEDGDFEINIEKDEVEIICDWDHGYGGSGTKRMYINRKQLIALLSKMDEV